MFDIARQFPAARHRECRPSSAQVIAKAINTQSNLAITSPPTGSTRASTLQLREPLPPAPRSGSSSQLRGAPHPADFLRTRRAATDRE